MANRYQREIEEILHQDNMEAVPSKHGFFDRIFDWANASNTSRKPQGLNGSQFFRLNINLSVKKYKITKFINLCKDNENENGGIKQSFFSDSEFKKIKFLSGPFSNLIFDVIERKKDKIKLSLGGIKTTINMDSENLFSPVF